MDLFDKIKGIRLLEDKQAGNIVNPVPASPAAVNHESVIAALDKCRAQSVGRVPQNRKRNPENSLACGNPAIRDEAEKVQPVELSKCSTENAESKDPAAKAYLPIVVNSIAEDKNRDSKAAASAAEGLSLIGKLDNSFSPADSGGHTGVNLNPAVAYLLTLGTDQSRRRMLKVLDRVARMFGSHSHLEFPWAQLRHSHLLALKAKFEHEHYSPNTTNLYLCALRGVSHQAWAMGLISDHDERVIASVKGSRGSRAPRGRALEFSETNRLIESCAGLSSAIGIRDAAIFALGAGCGLRRNEIATAKLADYDASDGVLYITGKGNKEREVYPPPSVADRLADWLSIRSGRGGDTIFCSVRRGGKVCGEKSLSADAVYKILSRRAKAAGIEKFTPHDLRRTFATRLLDKGVDLITVKTAMGHSNVQTTQRYDKRDSKRLKKIASLLDE